MMRIILYINLIVQSYKFNTPLKNDFFILSPGFFRTTVPACLVVFLYNLFGVGDILNGINSLAFIFIPKEEFTPTSAQSEQFLVLPLYLGIFIKSVIANFVFKSVSNFDDILITPSGA